MDGPHARRCAVPNLARNDHYEDQQANHVHAMAGQLFEPLDPLHKYSLGEWELLNWVSSC
jgi:hypothetical protein